jgi:lipopolysaccharide biosynthesis glycosyltransferase
MANFAQAEPAAQAMHIAFGVDADYVRAMGVAIASIVTHNPKMPFIFHVFAPAFSEIHRQKLAQLEALYGTDIRLHTIDPCVFNEYARFPTFAQYSAAIFTRLLIPQALRDQTSRVLYLDADILCIGELGPLMSIDLDDDIVGVVHDNGDITVRTQCTNLNLQRGRYFNSGVLLIDIEAWIEHDISRHTMEILLSGHQRFIFPDQDALNIVLEGRATYIAEQWNYQYNLNSFLNMGQYNLESLDKGVLIHFTGRVKPWHAWSLHQARDLFQQYQSHSPWAGTPLDIPRNYKEMRLYSQFLARRGNRIKAIYWFARYMLNKFVSRPKLKSTLGITG